MRASLPLIALPSAATPARAEGVAGPLDISLRVTRPVTIAANDPTSTGVVVNDNAIVLGVIDSSAVAA